LKYLGRYWRCKLVALRGEQKKKGYGDLPFGIGQKRKSSSASRPTSRET